MKGKGSFAIIVTVLATQCLSFLCAADDFDFFYFVQQWPGSYCDTNRKCCYPKTGKPAADFSIHGLWPNFNDGSYPSNCNPENAFEKSEISDLIGSLEKNWPSLSCPSSDDTKFWTHEWEKHGTCSESELDQHEYFEAALKLKQKVNLLQSLENAGIKPNNEFYSIESVKEAIKDSIGFEPGMECNVDSSGNSQIYQIYVCVDTSGAEIIECPVLPRGRCASKVQFPSF
ncbi:ribonuclease 3-like [Rhodamnia argentea]|uniref:Ribonuclease 3-like n=1 Tax=Rhodamnia argentea TaxID=178133 RepID=A0A8B8Q7V7_9MYRT|nr:ribonuclease 3-like [Rhodamnia argentea]